jgi:hypothetical protein
VEQRIGALELGAPEPEPVLEPVLELAQKEQVPEGPAEQPAVLVPVHFQTEPVAQNPGPVNWNLVAGQHPVVVRPRACSSPVGL